MPELFPVTHCSKCGAMARRMADQLYRLDAQVLHTCKPEADKPPLTLLDAAAQATWANDGGADDA
jgi:hypothetical protein